MMSDGWRVGIDIGGTFTDVVALDGASGEVRTAKVATRADDRVAGLRAVLAAVGLDWGEVAPNDAIPRCRRRPPRPCRATGP